MKLSLPKIMAGMSNGEITKIHIAQGDAIKRGTILFEIRVDLSGVVQLDCPPVSSYRFVSRESATVESLSVEPGDLVDVGAELANFASDSTNSERELRFVMIQCANSTLGDLFG